MWCMTILTTDANRPANKPEPPGPGGHRTEGRRPLDLDRAVAASAAAGVSDSEPYAGTVPVTRTQARITVMIIQLET